MMDLVHITRDGGESWENVSRFPKRINENSYIAQVHASTFNASEAFAVINDYRRGDWTPIVLHTDNYGKKWKNILENSDVEGYALSFVQDLIEPNLMFVGTEFGLFITIDGGTTWTKWTNEYPTVPTYDMVIHPREHDLVIATFGRSFWIMDDIRPLRELAKYGVDELQKGIKAFPSPDAYLANWRQAKGSRFAADGVFFGENRTSGAMLTYSINKDLVEGSGEDKKEEKVTIEIFDEEGKKLRTLSTSPNETGINRTTWNLDRKGVRYPSRTISKKEQIQSLVEHLYFLGRIKLNLLMVTILIQLW